MVFVLFADPFSKVVSKKEKRKEVGAYVLREFHHLVLKSGVTSLCRVFRLDVRSYGFKCIRLSPRA